MPVSSVPEFTSLDYWKAIVLYGLNAATYKIALGNTLLNLAERSGSRVAWEDLSQEFFDQFVARLSALQNWQFQSVHQRSGNRHQHKDNGGDKVREPFRCIFHRRETLNRQQPSSCRRQ